MITLRIKKHPSVPLEAESILPDRMAGKTNDAIRALPVFLGKRQCRLDEFFEVEGDGSDQIEIHGDLSKVKWIGREMLGNAGTRIGERLFVDRVTRDVFADPDGRQFVFDHEDKPVYGAWIYIPEPDPIIVSRETSKSGE